MTNETAADAGSPRSILFIDGDEPFCDTVAVALRAHGHEVHATSSAWDALRILDRAEMRIDTLVSDIRMPPGQPHGFSIARMARRKRRGVQVIYLTAFPELAEADDGARLGRLLVKRTAVGSTVQDLLAALRAEA